MENTNKDMERVILVAVEDERSAVSAEESLDELEELVRTAGAEASDKLIQKREAVHPGHYIGKGKLDELKDLIALHGATGIVCDDELRPGQIRRMSEILETKIMDRTMVILDIFASRASSAEGKAQVELAQLKYRLSHLSGLGKILSRLGGGIGTRGPGEKKLETDRRHIRERVNDLQRELKEIRLRRGIQREKREKNNIPVISLAGYTNAGKSTLMNLLTNAGVLEENKLFATLDTTTRRIKLKGGTEALITDTVGFIRKLPHSLIEAFRATLEEMSYADILIHVADASNPAREAQVKSVYDTLKELKCLDKPIITVFNKMDKEVETPLPADKIARAALPLSARTGEGADALLDKLEEIINSLKKRVTVCIPYSEGRLVSLIHDKCEVLREEHTENGTLIEIYASDEIYSRVEKYIDYTIV